ncbi:DUF4435 domain-containing protein [Vibrio antiquarius]|uniref:DUF4435 domain-containing protein n=1 Tax=Vibrio antiquarius (strain Ex25) TaxID=150340 RepID=UPI0026586053|nr:DUF4435 domain-containing protein [Vibrio antiquarius]MCR9931852.1 DUF4435 domain-containing protein [Vibrio antiquarius]
MNSLPRYTGPENLRRIKMEKKASFLLVEGPMDLSIYQETYLLTCRIYNLEPKKIVLFGGGKENILKWAFKAKPKNVSILLDRDFDFGNYDFNPEYIFTLDRYSIENYFFEKDVIVNYLATAFCSPIEDVKRKFNMDTLLNDWNNALKGLLPVLFFYQKHFSGDKEKWNTEFICNGKSYTLCPDRIDSFKQRLLDEMNVSLEDCVKLFNSTVKNNECMSVTFPGKLLLESFYRFIKEVCSLNGSSPLGSLNNAKSLKAQLIPRLTNSESYGDILYKVASY